MKKSLVHLLFVMLVGAVVCVPGSAVWAAEAAAGSAEMPVQYIGPGLPDANAPDGRLMYSPGVQNIQIYRGNRKPNAFFGDGPGYTYHHHIDLACWKGRFYAVWDMSPIHEDTFPCRLVYSTSSDGFNWTEPKDLYPANEAWNLRFYFFRASNDRMLVFAAGPRKNIKRMNEAMKTVMLVREITADHKLGEIYTLIKPGPDYPPSFEGSKDAGFVAACREALNNRPLLEQQDYGNFLDDRKMKWHDRKDWPNGKMGGNFGKAFCFYHRKDGALVGVCKMGFVTESLDEGLTWSLPVVPKGIVTGMAKVWAQKTPDGRYVMLYNPQRKYRFPLAITTSSDGITFRDMCVVHGDQPPQRYAGNDKNIGAQYVRGVSEWAGDAATPDKSAIWVIYSVNKEDIWVSRIPVPTVADTKEAANDTFDNIRTGPRVPGWNIYSPTWAPVRVAKDPTGKNQYLELEDREPVDYARAIRTFPKSSAVDVSFRLAAAQADRGRLEIELLGERGTRPVRVVLNDKGQLQAADGQKTVDLGTYKADNWSELTLKVKDGRFTLLRAGKPILQDAAFAEPSSTVYALSLRTGEFRGTVSRVGQDRDDKLGRDIPNTEEPLPAVIYRIDDVVTK
jgi:hypothetical protein